MPVSYRDAGVDIDAGEELVRRIAPLARATRGPQVISDVGGFAGLFAVPGGLKDPVLVSGTDGVGTKLKVALDAGKHDSVGIDLVAMCVNDILCVGAQPLFFLDYFATGKLEVDVAEAVVAGIAKGCTSARCALLGGETAELPGMYPAGVYDLAGFAVGVVERDKILGAKRVQVGDALVAIGSSGLHSNGYSLARRVLLDEMGLALDQQVEPLGMTVAEALLQPTRIYAAAVSRLLAACAGDVHALAHITGGGLLENVPRSIPKGMAARVRLESYSRPALFDTIQRGGPVEETEMRRTFNLGVGMVAVVAADAADAAIAALRDAEEEAWLLGDVVASDRAVLLFE
jgi:phosphoribosylformylglycinamidine cyclo-ligase